MSKKPEFFYSVFKFFSGREGLVGFSESHLIRSRCPPVPELGVAHTEDCAISRPVINTGCTKQQ